MLLHVEVEQFGVFSIWNNSEQLGVSLIVVWLYLMATTMIWLMYDMATLTVNMSHNSVSGELLFSIDVSCKSTISSNIIIGLNFLRWVWISGQASPKTHQDTAVDWEASEISSSGILLSMRSLSDLAQDHTVYCKYSETFQGFRFFFGFNWFYSELFGFWPLFRRAFWDVGYVLELLGLQTPLPGEQISFNFI
jgi:hypothetical protein